MKIIEKDIYMGKSEFKESWQFIYNDSGSFWKDGHEIVDPVFGQLYCARHTYRYGAEVMAYLAAIHKETV